MQRNRFSNTKTIQILWFVLITISSLSFTKQNQIERQIAIITCSYNNAPWVQQNLDSIFLQNYVNFRLIYVDDCSEDGTAELVEDYIEKNNLQNKVTLIANKKRQLKCHNIYTACHSCNDQEIIVILDVVGFPIVDRAFALFWITDMPGINLILFWAISSIEYTICLSSISG